MARVTVNVNWDDFDQDTIEAAEEQARGLLKLYGFLAVSPKAFRVEGRTSVALTGPRKDVLRAKDLFHH